MVFRFKNKIAVCNEFYAFKQENLDMDTLHLMFPSYTKEIDLKPGAKEYIYFKMVDNMNKGGEMTSMLDLSDWEID